MANIYRNKSRQNGVTLIELIVVLVILGLLAGLVAGNFIGQSDKAKQNTAYLNIKLLGGALDQFRLDVGRYPTGDEGLVALQVKPGGVVGWAGPYLKEGVPLDPWNTPFYYRSPGEHGPYDIWSYGADNAPGGEGASADVESWAAKGMQEGTVVQ